MFAGYDIAHEFATSGGACRISAADGADGAPGPFSNCSLFGLIGVAVAALREPLSRNLVQQPGQRSTLPARFLLKLDLSLRR